MSTVIVVTNVEMGWDCVIGVYASEKALLDNFEVFDLDTGETHLCDTMEDLRNANDTNIFHTDQRLVGSKK